MKNKLCLLFLMCFFTACNKSSGLAAKENKNDIISNESFGELEKIKPCLEIQIGTERNQVKDLLKVFNLDKEDEDSISYDLFKIYDDLENAEDADIKVEAFYSFDENNLLRSFDISIQHTIPEDVSGKIAYNNYHKLNRFISKYYKSPSASFEIGEKEQLKFPTIDLWETKKEKILLSILSMDLFGYQFTVYTISKTGK